MNTLADLLIAHGDALTEAANIVKQLKLEILALNDKNKKLEEELKEVNHRIAGLEK